MILRRSTGSRTTGRFDLTLHWVLFGNMLVTSPLFNSAQWLNELARNGRFRLRWPGFS